MNDCSPCHTEFDEYAEDYDHALAEGISVSGEDKDYFARGRVAWLADCLKRLGESPRLLIDYGCGTGSSTPFFLDLLAVQSVVGTDTSEKALAVARRTFDGNRARFLPLSDLEPAGDFDIAFCNGVFHHIAPRNRARAVEQVHGCLRPDGLFALWENNPWNPGTRYVMSRIPFDRGAITLSSRETTTMLHAGGFEVLRTDFLFIFPRMLRWLRPIEPRVSALPLGAQYQVLARKR